MRQIRTRWSWRNASLEASVGASQAKLQRIGVTHGCHERVLRRRVRQNRRLQYFGRLLQASVSLKACRPHAQHPRAAHAGDTHRHHRPRPCPGTRGAGNGASRARGGDRRNLGALDSVFPGFPRAWWGSRRTDRAGARAAAHAEIRPPAGTSRGNAGLACRRGRRRCDRSNGTGACRSPDFALVVIRRAVGPTEQALSQAPRAGAPCSR